MSAVEKHYVVFYSPGTIFHETRQQPIESWGIPEACMRARNVVERHGAKPFAFTFITVLTADPIPDGRGGMLNVEEKQIAKSSLHFLGGMVQCYDDLLANPEGQEILISNMRYNNIPYVVVNENSYRSFNPFGEHDVVVDPATGAIISRGDKPDRLEYRARFKTRFGGSDG